MSFEDPFAKQRAEKLKTFERASDNTRLLHPEETGKDLLKTLANLEGAQDVPHLVARLPDVKAHIRDLSDPNWKTPQTGDRQKTLASLISWRDKLTNREFGESENPELERKAA